MTRIIPLGATITAIVLALGALLALLQERLFLAGTLLMFTAFAIYIRETNK